MNISMDDFLNIQDITNAKYNFYLAEDDEHVFVNSETLVDMLENLYDEYQKIKNDYEEYQENVKENFVQKKADPYLEYGINERDFN